MALTPSSRFSSVEKLPPHLRIYAVEQRPDRYTPRDHSAWRYIMRQSKAYFKDHAIDIYLKGLEQTGIRSDRIPSIAEIDEKLQNLGWGAVPVVGFIPPSAFLDFQARRILPIASDMRSVEHIHYTPAPDIVHEAAGHAPILADEEYSKYLTMYSAMAQKAIFSREDMAQYDAIRALSDIKENPDSTKEEIEHAEHRLTKVTEEISFVSEAALVARMNWWTVEYGLLGSLQNPKIYGAGLLSSVGESRSCLAANVRKIRLTVDCVRQAYNITEPQPQLFVADSISHLQDVLQEFEASLSYRRGGVFGLKEAKRGATVTTTVLDSGVQISGVLNDFEGEVDAEFLRMTGPVQICAKDQELPKQGVKQHASGFSSPLGRWKGAAEKAPHLLSHAEFSRLGLVLNSDARLEFCNGFVVEGRIQEIVRDHEGAKLIKWVQCRVTRSGKTYFQPDWGDFDMPIGSTVTSVFGGPADRERYGNYDVGVAGTSPSRQTPFTPYEISSFSEYDRLRSLRKDLEDHRERLKEGAAEIVIQEAKRLARDFQQEWLLRLEALELGYLAKPNVESRADLKDLADDLLLDQKEASEVTQALVKQGLELVERS